MKKVITTTDTQTASFFVDSEGDIFATKKEADFFGCVAEVVVPSLFVGSQEDQMKAAKRAYELHR